MNNKPTLEEATLDLNNIRAELEAMRRINQDASWLSKRDDVDSTTYVEIANKTAYHIVRGERVEKMILTSYPQLQ